MSLFKGLDTPFFDSTTGEPLAFGFVYFGQPNQNAIANPKVPYADRAFTTPLAATQELTIAGKFEQEVWLDGDYSVIITDSFGVQQAEYLIVPEAEGGGGGGGVPAGGTTGQVLAKASNTNYDTEWVAAGGGSDRRTVTALTSSSGIVTIDYEPSGDYFTLEPTENISGFIVTNPPTNGACIGIEITQGATPRTVVFGAEYQFTASSPLDTVPSGAGEKALLFMTTFNGGSMWWLTMDTLA